MDWYGRHSSDIAALDRSYQNIWATNIGALASYRGTVSQALQQLDEWQLSPHKPLGVSTDTAESMIRQYRKQAAIQRLFAVDHMAAAKEEPESHVEAYKQLSNDTRTQKDLAEHANALAEHCETMARLHNDTAEIYRDVSRDSSVLTVIEKFHNPGILNDKYCENLAKKYHDLSNTWYQADHHMKETYRAYKDSSNLDTEKYINTIRDDYMRIEEYHGINIEGSSTLQSHIDHLQNTLQPRLCFPSMPIGKMSSDSYAQFHQDIAERFNRDAIIFQENARFHTEEASNAQSDARSHQSFMDNRTRMNNHIHQFALRLKEATTQDRLADELEAQLGIQP